MKKHKVIFKILSYIPLAILVICLFFVVIAIFPVPGGIKLFSVASGSMEPEIHTGSLVIDKAQTAYKVGDVITFLQSNSRNTTTHRVVKIEKKDKAIFYQVKGDANNAPDQNLVPQEIVVGKVNFSIPLIGYIVAFSKTLTGLIVIIVIPATIIIYSELLNIKAEALRLVKVRQNRKLTKIENIEEKVGEEINEIEKDLKKVVKKSKRVNKKKK